ncbi:hypothetical protein [Streptomyces sp. KLOTTS4A1]|uniref:hypothetical protein n=1 Tax=Streptomyces sp. KLOTTS4A1 TaxID=3390996 RepID=UPI0039F502A4
MQRATADKTALELLVHGVGGATPEKMLGDPRTVRITGDSTAAVHRRAEDAEAERHPGKFRDEPVQEAYVWSGLTSGNGSRALWLLLLPFMVANLAHWMRPSARGHRRMVRLYGALVRLLGLTLTVLLVAAACEVALDLAAWQCAGTESCTEDRSWLGFLAPGTSGAHGTAGAGGGWWSQPGRRLALAALVPVALTALLWYLSHRTWSAYESVEPYPSRLPERRADRQPDGEPVPEPDGESVPEPDGESVPEPDGAADRKSDRNPDRRQDPEQDDDPRRSALSHPGFWYGRRFVARLRAAHTAAGLLTVAAAVGTSAARYDREAGGPALLDVLGRVLDGFLIAGGLVIVYVLCRRGRKDHTVDTHSDRFLVTALPLAALAVLVLSILYAGWDRPGWVSEGRLPGDQTFGGIALVQGVLVVALAVVAYVLHRSDPLASTALRGLGGPCVAMLACALGGVMSGGVAQRVGDWLDRGATPGDATGVLPGPPVVLSWQAAVIPLLLVVVFLLALVLAVRALRRRVREQARVERDYAVERPHEPRSRKIAWARVTAALTDRAPVLVGLVAAVTLLLGAGALFGAWGSGEVPGVAAAGAPGFIGAAAETAQALGSWLIGLGFILFVTWGRRAYSDASARRTIGILWDVGTFWPRAAHPFAPPCYAERAVPDLTWRMATWTNRTGGRLVISGHSQGSVLAAAAAWQLSPDVRGRIGLLTYGSPLARLYGRWFPAHFGAAALTSLHREVDCWRNLYRITDPIGGPIGLDGACGPAVDHPPLKDPLAYGRTREHPLPAPILGHSDYQADPVFAAEREALLRRLRPGAVDGSGAVHALGAVPTQPGPDTEESPGPGRPPQQ